MSSETGTHDASQTPKLPTGGALAELIRRYSQIFDELTQERHERGQEKYGPVKFLEPETDLFEELKKELLDASNYSRYLFIRLCIIEYLLEQQQTINKSTPLGQMRDRL